MPTAFAPNSKLTPNSFTIRLWGADYDHEPTYHQLVGPFDVEGKLISNNDNSPKLKATITKLTRAQTLLHEDTEKMREIMDEDLHLQWPDQDCSDDPMPIHSIEVLYTDDEQRTYPVKLAA